MLRCEFVAEWYSRGILADPWSTKMKGTLAARLDTDSPGVMLLEMTCLQPSLRWDLALFFKNKNRVQTRWLPLPSAWVHNTTGYPCLVWQQSENSKEQICVLSLGKDIERKKRQRHTRPPTAFETGVVGVGQDIPSCLALLLSKTVTFAAVLVSSPENAGYGLDD